MNQPMNQHPVLPPDVSGRLAGDRPGSDRFGKSDTPVQLADYRFLRHVAWVEEFIDVLGLDAITPVVEDWGSLIGLRCVGNRPDRFAPVVVANGNLLVVPEGLAMLALPASLEPQDLEFPHVVSPGGGMAVFEVFVAPERILGVAP